MDSKNYLEQIEENEELATILSSISCGVLQYRKRDHKLLRANKAALNILGYDSLEEFEVDRNSGVANNVLPEDRANIKALVDSMQQPGDMKTFEYRVMTKDGELRYCYGTVQLYDDIHDERIVLRTIMDVTDSHNLTKDLNHLLTMQRQMVTSLGCGVLAYTLPDRELLIVNNETKRIFRYNDEDERPLMQTILDYILPEDIEDFTAASKKLDCVGTSCSYRLHPLMEDGSRLTVECISKLRAFEDGTRFILSVLTDITNLEERTQELNRANELQKKTLAEIRRERQQYRNALVSDCEYSYRFDVTEGVVRTEFDHSVRGSLTQSLGITLPIKFNDLVKRWMKVMRPEFLSPEELNPMTAAELLACYKKGVKNIVTEYFNRTENRYFRRTVLLSEDEETGHIWAIAIIHDITNAVREETRKRNELALINHDLRNQIGISRAFSSIYFATWELNLETGIMEEITTPDWVKSIHEVSHGEYRAACNMMLSSFVDEDSQEEVRKFLRLDNMAARLKNESILSCDYLGAHYGWSTVSLIPFMRDDDGNVSRVIFALREISNEKRIELEAKRALEEAYEAANRANAAKTDFLASISHDIRTPMNGIIGMTAIASSHLDDKERVADCLSKISISSQHLLGLINEVLDMNKIESGKLDLNVEEFSLPKLIDNLLVIAKTQLTAKKHQLAVNIHDLKHEDVIGDSLRIQQVFVNLLSNAIKYTPEGGAIKLSLTEKNTNNPKIGCFQFTVEDNGIGMSEEFRKRLFEPFSRAKDQRVEKIQGCGLGMPIARNIVRMMNGDIEVESELSKGSKFTVTLFLEIQEKRNAEKQKQKGKGSATLENLAHVNCAGKRALLVEDNDLNAEIASELLSMTGLSLDYAVDGREAVEQVKNHPADYYDIIFMDIQMPIMNGYEATRAIRALPGIYEKTVPIIAMTANAFAEDVQAAKAAGMNEHIAKPLDIHQLIRALTKWLA